MRLRFLFVITIALLANGCKSTPDSPQPATDTLRIGSWNIEWLDSPNRRSGPAKGIRQSPEDLADYIAASGVSVLALQEIKSNADDGSNDSVTLSAAFDILNATDGNDWRHTVFRAPRNQNVGVAWNAGAVTLLNSPDGFVIPIEPIVSAQGKTVWSRPPRALFFSTGEGLTDFVIIPIHMKSNYGGDFAVHRAAEAGILAVALPGIEAQFADHDVFIIGDTNSQHSADESIQIYEDAGLIDLNDSDAITYWRGSSLDRILVPDGQPEFAEPEFEVYFDDYIMPRGIDETEFKARWSDHWMVVFTLRVMEDDD